MRRIKIVTSCLAAMAVLAALSVRAAEGEKAAAKPKHHAGGLAESFIRPALVKQLELTPDQQGQYKQLETRYQDEVAKWMKAHNFDLQKWRDDMRAAAQERDRAKLKELRAEHEPLVALAKQYQEKLKALLTPEQQKKFDELAMAHRPVRHPNAGGAAAPAAPPAAPAAPVAPPPAQQ